MNLSDPSESSGTTPALETPQTQFRAVEGGEQTHSGTALTVAAYAAIWVILFFAVWRTMQRQTRIEKRLAELEAALRRADRGEE